MQPIEIWAIDEEGNKIILDRLTNCSIEQTAETKSIYTREGYQFDDEATKVKIELNATASRMQCIQSKNGDKHLKGYMFDSLVYRYKLARHKMTEMEIAEERKSSHPRHDYNYYLKQEERDVMRFIQILDEVIGEHD